MCAENSFSLAECWYKGVCSMEADTGCTSTCVRFLEMSYLMTHSNLPKKRCFPQSLYPQQCDLNAFEQLADIKDSIDTFVHDGRNLYIASKTTGNGKTSWAIKLMLKYFDTIWAGNGFRERAIFIHVPTFLLKLKDFGNKDAEFEHIKRLLTTVDLVVWDDIASTDMSSYDYSQLLMYIDARSLNGLSNIYTGNIVDADTLGQRIGYKLSSRLLSSETTFIEFVGKDRR